MPVSHSHLRKQTAESMRTMLTSAVPDAVPVVAREPLLLHHRHPAPPKQQPAGDAGGGFPWLATAGFGYLTFSSGMALHRSRGDPGAATFVVFAYADLVLLFCFLRMYERADPGSSLRDWIKLAVWLLTAALTLAFSYKVAAVMPPPAAALVWAMALATVAGGFAAFFCFKAPAPGEMELRSADTLQASPLFLSSRSISKHISGGTRWHPPSLDLSSLDAHTPIEHNRAASSPAATSVAIGVISP